MNNMIIAKEWKEEATVLRPDMNSKQNVYTYWETTWHLHYTPCAVLKNTYGPQLMCDATYYFLTL